MRKGERERVDSRDMREKEREREECKIRRENSFLLSSPLFFSLFRLRSRLPLRSEPSWRLATEQHKKHNYVT